MNTERHLDPPDFETIEEILEGCFTHAQACEFAMCQNFINWYNDACDEDLTPTAEAWYNVCIENAAYILDWVKSNCQKYELTDLEITEHLLYKA